MSSGQGGTDGGAGVRQPPEDRDGGRVPDARPGSGEPAERPLPVRAGLGAFVAASVFGVVSAIVSVVNLDLLVSRTLADPALTFAPADLEATGLDEAQLAEAVVLTGIVLGLVLTAVQLLAVWAAWRGRGWGRVLLLVLGGLGVVLGLAGLGAGGSPLPFLTSLGTFQVLALITGMVLLALPPSADWFGRNRRRRRTG